MPIIIEHNKKDKEIILSNDIDIIIKNRRIKFYFLNNLKATITDTQIHIPVKDDENIALFIKKLTEGLETRYNIEIELSIKASHEMEIFKTERENFKNFSLKALDIRNNNCDADEFNKFTNVVFSKMKRKLYPLQLLSAYHLAFSQNACNFSVPGAGKTSIVYAAYSYLNSLSPHNAKYVDRLLIIGPLNSFGPWELEYESCFGKSPSSTRLLARESKEKKKEYLHSKQIHKDLTLISYASVNSLQDELKEFLKTHSVMVVLDEAHRIKNTKDGVYASSVLNLAEVSTSRVILTGTPLPNGYQDLTNLFKFIWPYEDIIKYGPKKLESLTKSSNGFNENENIKNEIDDVIESIKPYFIRIRKKDLNLAPIEITKIEIPLGIIQSRIYKYIADKLLGELDEDELVKINDEFQKKLVDAKFIRLQQAATNPSLLLKPLIEYDESQFSISNDDEIMTLIREYEKKEIPSKYIECCHLVKDIIENNGKVIIWCSFIDTMVSLAEYFENKGILSKLLYGGTPIKGSDIDDCEEAEIITREKIISEFHNENSNFKVIIANPMAVGESISLHKACHNAIYLERSFNAGIFIQSKDRIHRYGLDKDIITNYYYLISDETIDVSIDSRLDIKERRMIDVIENEEIPLFANVLKDEGNEDIKKVIEDYVRFSGNN